MGKTKRSFRSDDYEDENVSESHLHEEKLNRYREKFIEKALKTKNIDVFIESEEDDYDYVEDMMESGEWEEIEDYVACIECGKVLITEEDQKGAMYFYDEDSDETTTTCGFCMNKKD